MELPAVHAGIRHELAHHMAGYSRAVRHHHSTVLVVAGEDSQAAGSRSGHNRPAEVGTGFVTGVDIAGCTVAHRTAVGRIDRRDWT
jgi:hypothetical protein